MTDAPPCLSKQGAMASSTGPDPAAGCFAGGVYGWPQTTSCDVGIAAAGAGVADAAAAGGLLSWPGCPGLRPAADGAVCGSAGCGGDGGAVAGVVTGVAGSG